MNAGEKNNFSVVPEVPKILYVDDEPAHLNSLKSLFDGTINILTASSGNRKEFFFKGRVESEIETTDFELNMPYQ